MKWKEYPFDAKTDEPKKILDGCIEARRLLLTGFGGFEKVDKKKWRDAFTPTNVAISLIGESLLYSRLGEFIEECDKRKLISFLVTNGTLPTKLDKLLDSAEPTQLYVTLPAPDKQTYTKACRPIIKNGWGKLNESLELMKSFSCKTAVRLTMVKGLNMKNPDKYASLIKKAEPDYCEVKAYFHVGESQKRLQRNNMPMMPEIKKFAAEIADCIGYKIKDDDEQSRVVLLSKK